MVIETLKPGDQVLVAEACTHHAIEDDIGRVKIPRWIRQYVGGTFGSMCFLDGIIRTICRNTN